MTTPTENKALVQRFIDALNTGDVAGAAACFHAQRYYSHAHRADLAGTWEAMKAARRAPAFGDVSSEDIALLADADRVVRHTRWHGTHRDEFLGAPPTGRTVDFDYIEIWRIADGLIVEHWGGMPEMARFHDALTAADD